jgi:acyl-coenzyme A thioesterase PaaI-like protein
MRADGSRLDPARLHAVATQTNAAQRAMGTQLLAIERRAVTIGVAWREDLAAAPGGGLAPGVLAALLDHACSLAALVALDDEDRFGTTMSLRIDYLQPTAAGRAVHARAECVDEGPDVALVHGAAFHPDGTGRPLARAVCAVAIAR